MARRAFERADFRLALMRKDMLLALAEGQRLGRADAGHHGQLRGAHVGRQRRTRWTWDCAAVLAEVERMAGVSDQPWPIPSAE